VAHLIARTHARQIADVTHSRAMPPWLPEPQKLKFADELRRSDAEINLIKTGFEQGSDEPPERSGWKPGSRGAEIPAPQSFWNPRLADSPCDHRDRGRSVTGQSR
jgi:hypothetical protein